MVLVRHMLSEFKKILVMKLMYDVQQKEYIRFIANSISGALNKLDVWVMGIFLYVFRGKVTFSIKVVGLNPLIIYNDLL